MTRPKRALLAAVLLGLVVIAVLDRAVTSAPEVQLPDKPPKPPVYTNPLGAAVSLQPALQDSVYLDVFLRTYSSLTPENAMKWEIVHPAPGRWDFDDADALVDLARRTGRRIRGHPLVWDQQVPEWAGKGNVEKTLRDHVTKLVRRYRGRVAQWDVVNEPLEDDGSLTQSVWQKALGDRWMEVAFQAAHKADPQAELFLNEIAAERGRKFRALLSLGRRLKDAGVPIDGIGLQNHTTSRGYPRREVLEKDFAAIDEIGLDVEITEMDVVGAEPDAYAAAADACAKARNCTGVTVWGVTDRWSWIGAANAPLPFDAEGKPKPALAALTRPLRR
jgi:endo-1,4-beta-xylanase